VKRVLPLGLVKIGFDNTRDYRVTVMMHDYDDELPIARYQDYVATTNDSDKPTRTVKESV
jgi:hypothetical protein